ncbi:MAG: ferritin family protein [Proteobacteria bacterium]|nr:ferritin family protein [Pseudomonadota bacterium]
MSILFSASEVVTMAVEIEKNGMAFYNALAARSKNEKAKELYTFLAAEEVRHKVTFQKLLDGLKKMELTAFEEDEYNNYLGALTSSRIFRSDVNLDDILAEADTDVKAMNLAIDAEKDAILFYYELLGQALSENSKAIEHIIKEEKNHMAKLICLRAELTG